MIQKFSLICFFFLIFSFLKAQKCIKNDSTKQLKIILNGSVDAYFSNSFKNSSLQNLTSFTNEAHSIGFGMASLKTDIAFHKLDFVIDLGVGRRAREVAYNDTNFLKNIKQLYLSYTPKNWLKITLGTWATHIGYELMDPQLNKNYSMSYMFTNGPFTHTGIKADFTKKKNSFMIGFSKETDYRILPSYKSKKIFLIAQYSYAFNNDDKIYLNYVTGATSDFTKINQLDFVLNKKLSKNWLIGANATIVFNKIINDNKLWDGVSFYLDYNFKKWLEIQYRSELFNDKNQLKMFSSYVNGGSIFANTISANFKYKNFLVIPEFRIDNATKPIFKNSNKNLTNTVGNFLVAFVANF